MDVGSKQQRLLDGDEQLCGSCHWLLVHPLDPTRGVELPARAAVLGADRQLPPADQPVIVAAGLANIPLRPAAVLVDLLMVGPAVGEHRQDLGQRVVPGLAHVVQAGLDKLLGP